MRTFLRNGVVIFLALPGVALAQGRTPSDTRRQPTGTSSSEGAPLRQGGTITSRGGNAAAAPAPVGTSASSTPANRNPYNDPNYREGAPGTGAPFGQRAYANPQTQGNAEALGTSAPVGPSAVSAAAGVEGGATGVPGEPSRPANGANGALPGNPGPVGNVQTPNTAPTTGSVGANGSGASGTPGSIGNSGTHGIKGSGY